MADIQLYLGLDLGPEYTQLSYYNADKREPESVYHEEAKDTYMLPNIMFYSAYHKKTGDGQNGCYKFIDLSGWCAGAKASAYRFEENGTVVDRVYEETINNGSIDVEGRRYKASDLLVKMLVLHIKQFTDTLGGFVIKKLTVTVADTDPRIIHAVKGLKTALSLDQEQFNIVSHLDSGLCYIFAQPEPLRNNSVGLFDFGRDGLDFYRIDMTRKYPLIVTTQHTNYHERMNLRKFGRYHEDMDEAFAEIVNECMDQVFVSSVFLTGVGFTDNWMKQSAAILCQGRRVFVGQNIYTKGACYRSLGGVYTESLSRYFIDTEQTVKTNIGINLMDDKNTFWPIVYGGLEWFNTRGKVEVFLDDTRRIQIVYQDILTEKELRETIEIYGLPARPPKTTKLSIEVEYYGADKGAIVIRDLGFGNLYPTTNKIYRKEFDISVIKKKHEKKLESERVKAAEGDTEELIGEDPVDREAVSDREKLEQERIEAEEAAAQDALKHEIHMDLDDLRYRSEDDKDSNEAVVYYGTASPDPVGRDESEMDAEQSGEGEPELDMEQPDYGESEIDSEVPDESETADGEAAGQEKVSSDIDDTDEAAENNESDSEAVSTGKIKTDIYESDDFEDEDNLDSDDKDLDSEDEDNLDSDDKDLDSEDEDNLNSGEDGDLDSEEDQDLDSDQDSEGYDFGSKDDDDLDLEEDEPEQSRIMIPAFLRGQNFDPGE